MKVTRMTFKQSYQKFKKVYIIGAVAMVLLIMAIILGIFGLAAYKCTVTENGQFLYQPGLVFINLGPNGVIGAPVENGGVVDQEIGILIKPLIENGNIRFVMGLMAIILLIGWLILVFVAFFYFLAIADVPAKKKQKYEDSVKLIQKTN